jgi:nitroimidazol reductase NimA-like FMN-containing flavoprotein (pyridoxamine 5'-phosphate oxidase superfamily)
MLKELTIEEAKAILNEKVYGLIGCNDGFNTYIYPTNYVYDGQYILCQSMMASKILMMRENKRVCFQVEAHSENKYRKSVTVLGQYVELKNVRERYEAIKRFVEKTMHLSMSEEIEYLESENKQISRKENKLYKPVIYKIYIEEIKGSIEMEHHAEF